MNLTPIFKLLSDETRLRVILLLSKEELCVCELCGILDEPQPKISKVLSKLRDMDLVIDQRKEKFVFYSIKNENELLKNTINYILDHIEDYPYLLKDQSRLVNKEQFIDNCTLELQKTNILIERI